MPMQTIIIPIFSLSLMHPRSSRKAQASTEYIIILAMVIIVALIVVGVIGRIPRLGSSTAVRTSSGYWQQADIAIPASYFNQTSGSVVVRNNMPFKIMLLNMSIGPDYNATNLPIATLKSGAQATVTFVNNTEIALGDVSYTVSFIYQDLDGRLGPYSFTGDELLISRVQ